MRKAKIISLGRYLPPRVVTNKELEKLMDTSDEWIRTRTGIEERRYVDEGVMGADMAYCATMEALKKANMKPSDIQFIIYATLSPDFTFPGCGVFLQDKLGIGTIGALDIRNQCTGFIYGLSIADQYIKTGMYDCILVVGSEIHSTGLDFSTRGRDVAVLFGDGAGAAIVVPSDNPSKGILSTHLHSEGKYAKELWLEIPGSVYHPRITHKMLDEGRHYPKMNGRNVFRHAVQRFQEVIKEAVDANNLSINDIDLLITHQANLRITEMVVSMMGLRPEKTYNNIMKYGNTTAASIPIALDEAVEKGLVSDGSLICLAAFGSGFTWASALMRW